MTNAIPRPFRCRDFDVIDGRIFAIDDTQPIGVEIDASNGDLLRVLKWPLVESLRGRAAGTQVLATACTYLVDSPAAGGLVVLDRATGQSTVVPCSDQIYLLVDAEDATWLIAWGEGDASGSKAVDSRPVIWTQETETRFKGFGGGDDGRTVEDWRADLGDVELRGPRLSVSRLVDGRLTYVPVDLDMGSFEAIDSGLVGLSPAPSDSVTARVSFGGHGVSWEHGFSVLLVAADGTIEVLESVGDQFQLVKDGAGRLWIFQNDDDGAPRTVVRRVVPDERRVEPELTLPSWLILGPVGNLWLDFVPEHKRVNRDTRTLEEFPSMFHLWSLDGGDPIEIAAGTARSPQRARFRVKGDTSWFADGLVENRLYAISETKAELREVSLAFDIREYIDPPVPPVGVDLSALESSLYEMAVADLDTSQLTYVNPDNPDPSALIRSVELVPGFPDGRIVAQFEMSDRPSERFGRRWNIYDELGVPLNGEHDYFCLDDGETGHIPIPPPEYCYPDEQGVVWI